MIHYTCDRCQRSIDPDVSPRYVVRIDVEMIATTMDDITDNDSVDFLAELNEALEQESVASAMSAETDEPLDYLHEALSRGDDLDVAFAPLTDSTGFSSEQNSLPPSFDLCPQCYAAYVKNPLSRERALKLHFSNN